MDQLLEPSSDARAIRRRTRRDPTPRFQPDRTKQLDVVTGCPELQVPENHPARSVRAILELLDFQTLEKKFSSLGRRGYHPRWMLGVLVYGSLIGIHHSTKLAKLLKTDAALRLVAGGHAISEGRLRAFRRENEAFIANANAQILKIAASQGLLKPDELAVDSVRLRAHASLHETRTLSRSKKRLNELLQIKTAKLDSNVQVSIAKTIEKHSAAIKQCEELGRTNVVLTNLSAGLLKFPSGAKLPGHRVTTTACGTKERFIVDIFIDADGHDFGKLPNAIRRTREALVAAGVDLQGMQVAADAGYWSEEDLAFAAANRSWVDVLIASRSESRRRNDQEQPIFGAGDFTQNQDGSITCPAGTRMEGPFRDGEGQRYHGVGCNVCPFKSRCTNGKRRYLTINPHLHQLQTAMHKRMAEPKAQQRYNQRIATVEPVFSGIQDTMAYRRVSSRHDASIRAEIMLKVFAYNVSRLAYTGRICRVRILFTIREGKIALISVQNVF